MRSPGSAWKTISVEDYINRTTKQPRHAMKFAAVVTAEDRRIMPGLNTLRNAFDAKTFIAFVRKQDVSGCRSGV